MLEKVEEEGGVVSSKTKFTYFENWVWKQEWGSGPKLVYIALESFAYSTTCFPSIGKLIKYTELSRSSVKRHLKWLEDEGWILTLSRYVSSKDNVDRTNYYCLFSPATRYGKGVDLDDYLSSIPNKDMRDKIEKALL